MKKNKYIHLIDVIYNRYYGKVLGGVGVNSISKGKMLSFSNKSMKMINHLNQSIKNIISSDEYKNLTIDELNMLINIEGNGLNRSVLKNHINSRIRGINNMGTKPGNGSDESLRLDWMYSQINNNEIWGIEFKNRFKEYYLEEIEHIEVIGGRVNKYDFMITLKNGKKWKCEEKGTKGIYNLQKSKNPWNKSVQRLNGNLKNYYICKLYASIWYKFVVCSTEINHLIGNQCKYPTFEEWYMLDCCPQGDPKTEWGKENKSNVRKKWVKGSLNSNINGPCDGREIVYNYFEKAYYSDNKIKKDLIQAIQNDLNNFMNQKDIWITTCGQIPNIKYRFWNNIEPEIIKDINLKYKKGSDIIFECIPYGGRDNFECYLRWGKGCGFSNLRFDIR